MIKMGRPLCAVTRAIFQKKKEASGAQLEDGRDLYPGLA